ncbi:MAG TPA: copper resistance CopC family protein [Steroidobacteraceae bacterium]
MLKNSLLALALFGVVVAGTCVAHAKLQSSSPAPDAHLTEAPKTLTLNFSEAAKLAMLKLVRDGKEVPVPLDKSAKAGQTFTLTLPALSPGNYTVQWAAVAADDGHITKGSFVFSIAA